jgi:excisionase family DNA binding protein
MLHKEHFERKAFRQCYKIFKMLMTIEEEYENLKQKALDDRADFDLAVIRFSRMLTRVKRLIKEFIVAYETSAILKFDLDRDTLTLGFKGASRSLTIKPLEFHPKLIRELLEGMPKPSEIERIINKRIRAQTEREEQKVLPQVRLDKRTLRVTRGERELLSPGEASAMLGFSYKTLWRWWKEGKIEALRSPSGRLRYYRDDVERLLSNH